MKSIELKYNHSNILLFYNNKKNGKNDYTPQHLVHIVSSSQRTQFWAVVFECFAFHFDQILNYLIENADSKSVRKIESIDINYAVGAFDLPVTVKQGTKTYVCFPIKEALKAIGELKRSNTNNVFTMNWYCYKVARNLFDLLVLKISKDQTGINSLIEQYERDNIGDIQSYKHIINHPRQAEDRESYLKNNNINDLPINLV